MELKSATKNIIKRGCGPGVFLKLPGCSFFAYLTILKQIIHDIKNVGMIFACNKDDKYIEMKRGICYAEKYIARPL